MSGLEILDSAAAAQVEQRSRASAAIWARPLMLGHVGETTLDTDSLSQLPSPRGCSGWLGSDGWVKMQQIVRSGGREGAINVHYLMNKVTGALDDFKIVLQGAR